MAPLFSGILDSTSAQPVSACRSHLLDGHALAAPVFHSLGMVVVTLLAFIGGCLGCVACCAGLFGDWREVADECDRIQIGVSGRGSGFCVDRMALSTVRQLRQQRVWLVREFSEA